MPRRFAAVGRKGEALVFAPVAGAGFAADSHGAGATATDAATVDQLGFAIVKINSLVEQGTAQVGSGFAGEGLSGGGNGGHGWGQFAS